MRLIGIEPTWYGLKDRCNNATLLQTLFVGIERFELSTFPPQTEHSGRTELYPEIYLSEWRDLNSRLPTPKAGTLTGLSYIRIIFWVNVESWTRTEWVTITHATATTQSPYIFHIYGNVDNQSFFPLGNTCTSRWIWTTDILLVRQALWTNWAILAFVPVNRIELLSSVCNTDVLSRWTTLAIFGTLMKNH